MRIGPLLALALVLAPPAAAQPATERIGAWLLTCMTDRMTDRTECRLRHRDPVEGGDAPLHLEIVERGGRYLPVLVARDVTLEGAARVLTALTATAQMRFPPARLFEMPCGLAGRSVLCAPRPEDSARAAEEMLRSRTVLVRLVGLGGAGADAPPVELQMDGIEEAIGRLRARATPGRSVPEAPPGFSLPDLFRRLQDLF
ncbi:MAG: hypothetical protein NZM27_07150 [Acetobacteraceae bacterium]|nr:hypothetical protein [Acetobacteraceae bacterium]MCX7685125.1 hypothetical protein [Acetobacteraceae bacterium]